MFSSTDILYEDNHILAVNKPAGIPVQADLSGDAALEDMIKDFIKKRDSKPGAVFLGVIHRIDRPVSGVVLFAKTSKALTRMNQAVRDREIKKRYLAIIPKCDIREEGTLCHYIERNSSKNKSFAYDKPRPNAKEARLKYRVAAASDRYFLIDIDLITGRHHQIRAQLSKSLAPIKGDLKYGADRSNPDGSISLHASSVEFTHPVTKESVTVTAPLPHDSLWAFFEGSLQ